MKNKPYELHTVPDITSIVSLISHCEKHYPSNIAFTFMKGENCISKTYSQFADDVKTLATLLVNMGYLNKKIALVGENSYAWIVVSLAVIISGNIIVPIDQDLPDESVTSLLLRCEVSLFFYSKSLKQKLYSICEAFRAINLAEELDEFINSNRMRHPIRDCFSYVESRLNSVAMIIFTSGTTGQSKGVMLSQKNLISQVISCWKFIYAESPVLLVLPLHHTFAFVTSLLCPMLKGITIAINGGLKSISNDLKRFKPRTIFLVPLFVEVFCKQLDSRIKSKNLDKHVKWMKIFTSWLLYFGIDIRRIVFKPIIQEFGSELNLIMTGGAPIDFKYVQELRSYGIQVLNGYGITECSPVVSVNRNKHFKDGSAGLPLPCCEISILDPSSSGEGEICVKGENVMLGYYEDTQATDDAFKNGWFRTGDIGHIDSEGFLHITGRLKNIIICSNGKNVSPERLELLLARIPIISEVVVFQHNGIISAEVFPNKLFVDKLAKDELRHELQKEVDKLNKTLPIYEQISSVKLRFSEFDKTTTRKIIRI